MSTTPVREALRRPETEELVVLNAHRDIEQVAASLKVRRRTPENEAAADLAFHQAIYRACGNSVLMAMLGSLGGRTERYRIALANTDRYAHPRDPAHEEIQAALRARDAQATAENRPRPHDARHEHDRRGQRHRVRRLRVRAGGRRGPPALLSWQVRASAGRR